MPTANILDNPKYRPGYDLDNNKNVIAPSYPRTQDVNDLSSKDFKYGLEYGFDYSFANQNDFFYQDPLLLSFDIVLDSESPLLASPTSKKNSLSRFLSAYEQIPSIYNRTEVHNEFIDVLKRLFNVEFNVDKNKSFYINSIAGLDKITAKIVDYQKDKITITLNEDVTMISSYLSALYNNLSYSYRDQRYIIPANLLRFNMFIKVSDLRNMVMSNDDSFEDRLKKSAIIYQLRDCNFDFFQSKPFEETLVAGGFGVGKQDKESTIKFDIYYKSIEMEMYNPFIVGEGKLNNKLTSMFVGPGVSSSLDLFSTTMKDLEDPDVTRSRINAKESRSETAENDLNQKINSKRNDGLKEASSAFKEGVRNSILSKPAKDAITRISKDFKEKYVENIRDNQDNRSAEFKEFESDDSLRYEMWEDHIKFQSKWDTYIGDDFYRATSDMFDEMGTENEMSLHLRNKLLSDLGENNLMSLDNVIGNNWLVNFLRDRFLELTGLPKISMLNTYQYYYNPMGKHYNYSLDGDTIFDEPQDTTYYGHRGTSPSANNSSNIHVDDPTSNPWRINTEFVVKPRGDLGDVNSDRNGPTALNTMLENPRDKEKLRIDTTVKPKDEVELGQLDTVVYTDPIQLPQINTSFVPQEPIEFIDINPIDPIIKPTKLDKIEMEFNPHIVGDMGYVFEYSNKPLIPELGSIDLTSNYLKINDLGEIDLTFNYVRPIDLGEINLSFDYVKNDNLGKINASSKYKKLNDLGEINLIPNELKPVELGEIILIPNELKPVELGEIQMPFTLKPIEMGVIDTTPRSIEIPHLGTKYKNIYDPRIVDLGMLFKGVDETNIMEIVYLYTSNNKFKSLENIMVYNNAVSVINELDGDIISSDVRDINPFQLIYKYNNKINVDKTLNNLVLYNNAVNKINNLNFEKLHFNGKIVSPMPVKKMYDNSVSIINTLNGQNLEQSPKKVKFINMGNLLNVIKINSVDNLGKIDLETSIKKLLDPTYLYSPKIKESIDLGSLFTEIDDDKENTSESQLKNEMKYSSTDQRKNEAEYDRKYKNYDTTSLIFNKSDNINSRIDISPNLKKIGLSSETIDTTIIEKMNFDKTNIYDSNFIKEPVRDINGETINILSKEYKNIISGLDNIYSNLQINEKENSSLGYINNDSIDYSKDELNKYIIVDEDVKLKRVIDLGNIIEVKNEIGGDKNLGNIDTKVNDIRDGLNTTINVIDDSNLLKSKTINLEQDIDGTKKELNPSKDKNMGNINEKDSNNIRKDLDMLLDNNVRLESKSKTRNDENVLGKIDLRARYVGELNDDRINIHTHRISNPLTSTDKINTVVMDIKNDIRGEKIKSSIEPILNPLDGESVENDENNNL